MTTHRRLLLALLSWLGLTLAGGLTSPQVCKAASGPLILISIDGFRWDFLKKFPAPTLSQLAADGVHAERLIPSFPSKTFPNHYTLVTGLYPEHHGIVANWFYDPVSAETFNMRLAASNTAPHWWGGEPIWITAEKQSVRSACFFWPGSEAPHQELRPTFWRPYDGKLANEARVDGLLAWFDLPVTERPQLGTLYFSDVDTAGHTFGPDAPETAAAVQAVDKAIGRLLAGLQARGLRDQTNLIIVSDHGMSSCDPEKVIFLEDLMDISQVQIESTGPNGGVRPKPGVDPEKVLATIRAKAPPPLTVYRRSEVPAQLHYSEGERIPPLVLIAEEPWNIESKVGWPKRMPTYNRGSHGWDPTRPNMGALFIAKGPAFKSKTEIPPVENVHLYNLLCAVLGLAPAPNDGDDRLTRAALIRQP